MCCPMTGLSWNLWATSITNRISLWNHVGFGFTSVVSNKKVKYWEAWMSNHQPIFVSLICNKKYLEKSEKYIIAANCAIPKSSAFWPRSNAKPSIVRIVLKSLWPSVACPRFFSSPTGWTTFFGATFVGPFSLREWFHGNVLLLKLDVEGD